MSKKYITGRPKLAPHVKAGKACARAHEELKNAEQEFEMSLGLQKGEGRTSRGKEIHSLANKRLELAAQIEQFRLQLNDMRKSGVAKKKADMVKDLKGKLHLELKAMPDLGSTQAEWDEIDPEDRKMDVGKPPVLIETKLYRAQQALKRAHEDYIAKAKKAGVEPVPMHMMSKKYKPYNEAARPSSGPIKQLEYTVKHADRMIQHIESGEAQKEAEKRMKEATFSSTGKRMGRPFESPEARLARYKLIEKEALLEIAKTEAEMPEEEYLYRQIALIRRKLKKLDQEIVDQNLDIEEDYTHKTVLDLIAFERELEKKIDLYGRVVDAKMEGENVEGVVDRTETFARIKELSKLVEKERLNAERLAKKLYRSDPNSAQKLLQAI